MQVMEVPLIRIKCRPRYTFPKFIFFYKKFRCGPGNHTNPIDAVFWKGPNFCTKFDPLNDFSNDQLHNILKHRNLLICEHSSFFNY